jgi:hypothetical protein
MKIFVPEKEYSPLITDETDRIRNFNKYNANRDDISFVHNPEEADIIVIFEKWTFNRVKTYIDELYACSLVMDFPNKVFTMNDDDFPCGFLPGLYISLRPKTYNPLRHRTCCYAGTINEFIDEYYKEAFSTKPSLLFSFRGNIDNHPVRRRILMKYSNRSDSKMTAINLFHHEYTAEQKKQYIQEILNSYFVLCPGGFSPSSYRLYEVMALARCPVIISDSWIPIEGIAWDKCSIKVRESQIRLIPKVLQERKEDAIRLGLNARKVWEDNFSEESRFQRYMDYIIDIYSGRYKDYDEGKHQKQWKSRRSFSKNGWTFEQRIAGKIKRLSERIIWKIERTVMKYR